MGHANGSHEMHVYFSLYDMIVERYPGRNCGGSHRSANFHAVAARLGTTLEERHPRC